MMDNLKRIWDEYSVEIVVGVGALLIMITLV